MSPHTGTDALAMSGKGLSKIGRNRPTEEVRRQLERAVLNGSFQQGERLPPERQLAEMFGVSRVSVREAVRGLVALGLLRVEQGRGAFVNDRRSSVGEPLARWLEIHRDEVLELHYVRAALDVSAAEGAARLHDEAKLARVTSAHEAFLEAADGAGSVDEIVSCDVDFHLAIADASGNRLLWDLLTDLNAYVLQTRKQLITRQLVDNNDHMSIVDAIVAGDPERAREEMRAHMSRVGAALASSLIEGYPPESGLDS